MKIMCWVLMMIISTIMFFWMMIWGWGLEIKSLFPILAYYVWVYSSFIIRVTIAKLEE